MSRILGAVCAGTVSSLILCGLLVQDLQASKLAERTAAADELVQEALHREIYGLQRDRDRLLQEALQIKPDYAPAKWHQGYVRFRNEWVSADVVPQWAGRNLRRIAYERLREGQADTVAGNLAMANWCREKDLLDQERAHLSRVVDLEPNHRSARARLGFRPANGRWVEDAAIRATEERQQAERRAMAKWRPDLEEWRDDLLQRSEKKRMAAAAAVRDIQDPAAIPAMERVLSPHSLEAALLVVEALSQMPGQEAVESLMRHTVLSPRAEVRDEAAQQLKQRKAECFVPGLLAELYTPVISRTEVAATGRGQIGYRHVFEREGQDQRRVMILDTAYERMALPGGDGRDSLKRILVDTANRAATRERAVARENLETQLRNERITQALNTATNQQRSASPELWWQWWNQENDVVVQGEKQTRTIQEGTQLTVVDTGAMQQQAECFAAGTIVWTSTGTLAIEAVRVGDLVLSQDVDSGELSFKPVLRTTLRPQEPLFKVQIGEDPFHTTAGHLFWVSGHGWVRARELKSGMQVHTVGGGEMVVEIEKDAPSAETHNLVVADFHTYFVGKSRVLSHDVTNRRPTASVVPGLSEH
ncbi:MAG: polymorphic toxin-type HINT domain-containing protein [Pirellulaceae bacterium]